MLSKAEGTNDDEANLLFNMGSGQQHSGWGRSRHLYSRETVFCCSLFAAGGHALR